MKVGIYIPGLGQDLTEESVFTYAERFVNQIHYNTDGEVYELAQELVNYAPNKTAKVVSIINKAGNTPCYKFYEFSYKENLIEKFQQYSLIRKNLVLFGLVFRKFPFIVGRLFKKNHYHHPFQAVYVFFILLLISLFIILTIPSIITLLLDSTFLDPISQSLKELLSKTPILKKINPSYLKEWAAILVSINSFLIFLIPSTNTILSNVSTEFSCADDYLKYGVQKAQIQGNLELLMEYICENEPDPEIHFHAYSFGCIIAMDHLYPLDSLISSNMRTYCKVLITIGNPFEFIVNYYPLFFKNRNLEMENHLKWMNIYSIYDAWGSNFREDNTKGDAEFGMPGGSLKPMNYNYEVAIVNTSSLFNFIMMYSLKVHGMYWDPKPSGINCLNLVYDALKKTNRVDCEKPAISVSPLETPIT